MSASAGFSSLIIFLVVNNLHIYILTVSIW